MCNIIDYTKIRGSYLPVKEHRHHHRPRRPMCASTLLAVRIFRQGETEAAGPEGSRDGSDTKESGRGVKVGEESRRGGI